jgi:hypothetical protein
MLIPLILSLTAMDGGNADSAGARICLPQGEGTSFFNKAGDTMRGLLLICALIALAYIGYLQTKSANTGPRIRYRRKQNRTG